MMPWAESAARTDPEAPKHKGLSMLLVPVDQPGVVVRPDVHAAEQEPACAGVHDVRQRVAPLHHQGRAIAEQDVLAL